MGEETRTKMRFPLEVGILLRGQIKATLTKLKRDIEWEDSSVIFKIEEERGLLNSIFYVEIHNITASMALAVKIAIEKFVAKVNE
jgi:hypothetical protein